MLKKKTIGLIGAGYMGEALIDGLLSAGLVAPEQLWCADVRANRLAELQKQYGLQGRRDNSEVVRKSDIVILAVKPQSIDAVLRETAKDLDTSKLIISIAAGIPLSAIAAHSQKALRLVRAMPNICVSVKAGATAVAGGQHATSEDLETAMAIFNAVGHCVLIHAEHLLDAVTGLSGSGPAYVFTIMDALADGGVKVGLNRKEALLLAAQTLYGAAKMQLGTDLHPGQLKDRVTSPGGTTIAGLHALEKGGLRCTLIDAVEAGALRAKELGGIK